MSLQEIVAGEKLALFMMKSFNAIHPTIGAGAGLTIGEEGSDAMIEVAGGVRRSAGLFVGVRQERTLPWRVLPLFAAAPPAGDEKFETLSGARYGRTFAMASDRWLIGPLVLKLCTPFWETSDPATCDRDRTRLHLAPAIGGFVEYDNTHSEEPVEVIVGFGMPGAMLRRLGSGVTGFASSEGFGFATVESNEVRMRLGITPLTEAVMESGDHAALVFSIPAKAKRVFPLSIAIPGREVAGDAARRYFAGLDDVIANSLANNAESVRRSDELDAEWFASPGSREEKIARAHEVRAHLAETRVVCVDGRWSLGHSRSESLNEFDAKFFPWAYRRSGI